jgi:probable metal-binding protein
VSPVFGHELLSLLQQMGGRASVEALRNAAAGAFGVDAVYGNCHGDRFSFHEVLAFLASRGKLEHRGDEISLGSEPACSGH